MIINSKRNLKIPLLLVLGSYLATHLCFLLLPNVFEIWNAQTVDQLFVLRSSTNKLLPSYDRTVVHIDLNNSSIQRMQNLYLDRSHHARVIRNLASMGVSAQVFDFIFASRKSKENDDALIRATKEAGNVYFGLAFELRPGEPSRSTIAEIPAVNAYLDQTKWDVSVIGGATSGYAGENPLITYPDLAYASRGLGSISIRFDPDGALRRVPLLVRYKQSFYPLLPFRVVCDYLNVSPDRIVFHPGKHLILRGAKKPGDAGTRDIRIPIDKHGNMIINYVGPWDRMDHYNFSDIYLASNDQDELELWADELGGKIVVIADVSTGVTDIGPVPTDANFPMSGAHANIIHNILAESFLRELSRWEMVLVEMLIMVVILTLSLRFTALYFSFGTVLLATVYIGSVALGFFYYQVIFHIVRPLLMMGFALVSINIYRYINEEREKLESLRERDFIRDTFGRYMSSEVAEELLDNPAGLNMKGETREVTFLVSDLRGFTALTTTLSPHEIIEVMNRYFEHMVEVISKYRGVVNEFMGDGILVFFGAPLKGEDDAQRAVACAIEMQGAMEPVNDVQRRLNLPELSMGIGINSGEVVVGNIGSARRAAYGAVGSPINIAYRIEAFTVGGQILISPSTYDQVQSEVVISEIKQVQFKGIDHPVNVYDVVGLKGAYNVHVPEKKAEKLFPLDPPIAISCYPLEGKIISNTAISGRIVRLGETVAEALLSESIQPHTNLRLLLGPRGENDLPEIYAKVLPTQTHGHSSSEQLVTIQFTWLPEEIKPLLTSRPAEK